jgi:undecaprenyl diphosphate synthase
MQEPHRDRMPEHVAIIMDGNGRWAERQGLPRSAGHRAGVDAVRTLVRAAEEVGIRWLTLYAFSSENWNRPRAEVELLMKLPEEFFSGRPASTSLLL